jgi:hypothetical protein
LRHLSLCLRRRLAFGECLSARVTSVMPNARRPSLPGAGDRPYTRPCGEGGRGERIDVEAALVGENAVIYGEVGAIGAPVARRSSPRLPQQYVAGFRE